MIYILGALISWFIVENLFSYKNNKAIEKELHELDERIKRERRYSMEDSQRSTREFEERLSSINVKMYNFISEDGKRYSRIREELDQKEGKKHFCPHCQRFILPYGITKVEGNFTHEIHNSCGNKVYDLIELLNEKLELEK